MEILSVVDKSGDRLLGRGARLDVVIPYVAQWAVTNEPRQKKELAKAKRSGTILIVEDEESIREMTTMYLEAEGYRVVGASDGAEAVTLWQKYGVEIGLVLTDVIMPGCLNGQQLVKRLKADRPDLQAIVVSGRPSDLLEEETCLGTTMRFVQKPYRLRDLADVVHDCLGRDDAE